MNMTQQNCEIERLLQPGLNALRYELWGCEIHQQRNRTLLRVYIDQEQGITWMIVKKQVTKSVLFLSWNRFFQDRIR